MQQKKAWAVTIIGCSVALLTLAAFKYKQISDAINTAAAYPEPIETVTLAIATTVRWQPSLTVTAELIAIEDVEISNELPGRVVELGAAPGQRVAKGELLFKLDTREEEAELLAAQADAKLAQLALSRNERLKKTGAASAEALDRAAALFRSTQARVSGWQAIIDKKTLRAPFAGTLGLHQLSLGQYLDAGTIITRLIGLDKGVWVDFNLPQYQATLSIGDTVTIDATDLSAPVVRASIIARDAWVDTTSRNMRYRALPEANSAHLYPGALVSVAVKLGSEQTAAAVPITSVRRDPYGTYVFTLVTATDAPAVERAQRRPVRVGAERAQQAIITEGLSPGERVAGDGSFKLRDGIRVHAASGNTPDHEAP